MPVMRLAVTSDTMSVQDMTVIVQDQIEDELAAVPGVADVQVYGDRDKIFRIDVDQNKLASLGFTVADLRAALASVAFDSPAGSITTTNQDLIVRTTADVTTPEEFENIIIGGTTRIRDVATVTLGPDIGQTSLRSDGKTGIGLGIIRQAESNTLDISTGVKAAVAKLQENLPKGMSIKITSDDAVFVNGAVHEVEIALGLSISMVLIVIYIFLLDWRATLIPALSMPVAMIGTIAAIYLAGFSINILTLLALVLATGLVVDDAIVVLGKHRATAQRRHGAARGRRARRAGSVLRRHRHDADAGRRLRADLVSAGTDRRPVSRIRLRACHVGAALLRGGADALPDAGLAHADRRVAPPRRRPWHWRPHRRRAECSLQALPCTSASTRRGSCFWSRCCLPAPPSPCSAPSARS